MREMSLRISRCLIFALITLTSISTLFITKSSSSPTTIVYVSPEKNESLVGQTFTIEVKISNAEKIYGWEFKLKWNPNLLEIVKVAEGDFLKQKDGTFFTTNTSKASEGLIVVDCTLLSNVSGVDGNGTLATIEFYAKVQGECLLELEQTILVNELEQSVPHTVSNGEVAVKPLSLIDWLKLNLSTISIIIALSVVIISLWFIASKRLKGKLLVSPKTIPLPETANDEDKVVHLLRSAGGRLLQSTITDKLKFSKSKTSNLLKMMEAQGKIRRERKGRDKIVTLVREPRDKNG